MCGGNSETPLKEWLVAVPQNSASCIKQPTNSESKEDLKQLEPTCALSHSDQKLTFEMPEKEEILYGYLMDVMSVVKYVVHLQPEFRQYIEENPYVQWQLQVYTFVAKHIGAKVGIPDLRVRTIWLGSGLLGSIWSLPKRLLPTIISKEDEPKLRKLQQMFGNKEPSVFYAYGEEEPEYMKNSVVSPDLAEMSLNHVVKAFSEDSKAVMRKLLSEHE